jgi:SAM-dependent methyltransferase
MTVGEVSAHVRGMFGEFVGVHNLNLGCGDHPEPGFLNLDRVGGFGADVIMDLERCGEMGVGDQRWAWAPELRVNQLPWAANTFDCVLASHILEHLTYLIDVMREIHRVLKPGGHLIAVAPYASCDAAWEDPTHVRAFTERSWSYFDQRLYQTPGHAGAYPSPIDYCFDVVKVDLVLFDDIREQMAPLDPLTRSLEIEVKKRFMRNIIREQHAVLRKVETVR